MSKKLKGKLISKAGNLLKKGYRKLKAGERRVSEGVGSATSPRMRRVTEATRGTGTRTLYRGTKNKMKTKSVDKMVRRGRGVAAGTAAAPNAAEQQQPAAGEQQTFTGTARTAILDVQRRGRACVWHAVQP